MNNSVGAQSGVTLGISDASGDNAAVNSDQKSCSDDKNGLGPLTEPRSAVGHGTFKSLNEDTTGDGFNYGAQFAGAKGSAEKPQHAQANRVHRKSAGQLEHGSQHYRVHRKYSGAKRVKPRVNPDPSRKMRRVQQRAHSQKIQKESEKSFARHLEFWRSDGNTAPPTPERLCTESYGEVLFNSFLPEKQEALKAAALLAIAAFYEISAKTLKSQFALARVRAKSAAASSSISSRALGQEQQRPELESSPTPEQVQNEPAEPAAFPEATPVASEPTLIGDFVIEQHSSPFPTNRPKPSASEPKRRRVDIQVGSPIRAVNPLGPARSSRSAQPHKYHGTSATGKNGKRGGKQWKAWITWAGRQWILGTYDDPKIAALIWDAVARWCPKERIGKNGERREPYTLNFPDTPLTREEVLAIPKSASAQKNIVELSGVDQAAAATALATHGAYAVQKAPGDVGKPANQLKCACGRVFDRPLSLAGHKSTCLAAKRKKTRTSHAYEHRAGSNFGRGVPDPALKNRVTGAYIGVINLSQTLGPDIWQARIQVGGAQLKIGTYATAKLAALAYDEVARQHPLISAVPGKGSSAGGASFRRQLNFAETTKAPPPRPQSRSTHRVSAAAILSNGRRNRRCIDDACSSRPASDCRLPRRRGLGGESPSRDRLARAATAPRRGLHND